MRHAFFIIILLLAGISAQAVFGASATNRQNSPTNATMTNADDDFAKRMQSIEEKETQGGAKKDGSSFNPILTVIKIVVYLALFGGAAFLVIRFVMKKGAVPFSEDDNIVEVILTKSIGLGSYFEIVKVGPLYYLISVSGQQITLIDKLTDKETIDYIELNKDRLKPKQTKFFDILTFFPQSGKGNKIDFLKKQKDKLKNL